MANKFIVWKDVDGTVSEPEETIYSYEVDDIIVKSTYGNQYKCVEVNIADEKTIYCFKQGKPTYTFDW